MRAQSLRVKLIASFLCIGLCLVLFMVIVVPSQTTSTAEKVMLNDVEFIVSLLADNLALGMQTRELDEGAALQQTLDLLKGDVVASVAVLDPAQSFVKGLNTATATLRRDTVVNRGKVLSVFRTMKDGDGATQGFVEIVFSKDSFIKGINRFKVFIWLAGLGALAAVIVVGGILSNRITGPLNRSVQMLQDLASGEGDLTRRLSFAANDEVGRQAHWINEFIAKLQAMVAEIKRSTDGLAAVSDKLSANSSTTAELALTMKDRAQGSSRIMGDLTDSTGVVMESIRETSQAVGSIAAAIQEMSLSSNEIAKSCVQESEMARKAHERAGSAKEKIKALEEMAREIGKVIELIQDIANKTNLLALNATIQAVSAGAAGRGFAVVANEVKELAKQTTHATQEINTRIQSIRETVQLSVEEINSIASIINDVNNVSQSIVVAVEEQSATTNEISRNVGATSRNAERVKEICEKNSGIISQVSSDIALVNSSAQKTEDGVQRSRQNIGEMTSAVDKMHLVVGRFKV